MKKRMTKSGRGIALAVVLICVLIFTILGFSVLSMVNSEIGMAQNAVDKIQAFYLAEAGLERFSTQLSVGLFENIAETSFGDGSYSVDFYPNASPPYAIATGEVEGQVRRIKVTTSFLAPPYECGIYAGGYGGTPWALMLRGTGNPVPNGAKQEVGGKDIVNGNIFVDGDVALYQQSSINPPLAPNPFNLDGDVDATGNIDLYDTATVSGDVNEGAPAPDAPDLIGMNYATTNTHNVSQTFTSYGITKGYLPSGHVLRDVFVKNPNDRTAECGSTTGDDFFFEPSTGFIGGTWQTAPTPLHAGTDRVYYIDGNLWVNSKNDTYGFNMDGKATIVVTGNVYICDNLKYANADSMLGIVALGKYNSSGNLISGGNVYFGDPTYGTMYTFSAMMFAANDFLFNSRAIGTYPKEPESGFTLNGNLAALNRVSVERDWYTDVWNQPRPARYNPATSKWYDSGTGAVLTSTQVSTLRHYQMVLNYDDRIRNRHTQPRGLPRGVGYIFEGLIDWEEVQ